jgi:hypothetical protein
MLSAKHRNMLFPIFKSKRDYWVDYANQFLVLPDGRTIIGVDWRNKSKLLCEDILRNDPFGCTQIGSHLGWILTVYYSVVSRSLFVGDTAGTVVQYKPIGSYFDWHNFCNFGNLKIGQILSVAQTGDFLIFGGNDSDLRAIDIAKKEVLQGTLTTAFKYIHSLQTCELPDKQVQLSVTGSDPIKSDFLTDIFRVKPIKTMEKKRTSLSSQLSIEEQEKLKTKVKSQETCIINLENKVNHLESELKEAEGQVKVKDERLKTLENELLRVTSQKNKKESHINKIEKELASLRIECKPLKDGQNQKSVRMQTPTLHKFESVNHKEVESIQGLIS